MVDDSLGFGHHLRLANPQGCRSDSDGKIVDFDAIELVDAHLDGVDLLKAQERLPVVALTYRLVLQPPQRQVGLGEEIAATAGGVKERQACQFLAIGIEAFHALLLDFLLKNRVELVAQIVQEKRVDDLVDVLDAGIMHAAAAARLGVKGALEHGAEDGGRNLAPVKIQRSILQ